VTLGLGAFQPIFDGTNIWVPNNIDSTVSVVRARGAYAGTVLQTLTGIEAPNQAAFDGERILVTGASGSVALWRASDLTSIGKVSTGGLRPTGACSDGINFWISLHTPGFLARL
jgi:hypothetical protein